MKLNVAALLYVLLTVVACSPTPNPSKSTVMITNRAGNSGGSGSIIVSKESGSAVLTNSHVCELLKSGGMVHSEAGSFPVVAFKQSMRHDLCVASVAKKLGNAASISMYSPNSGDKATVSGHPHLLPTITEEGYFSSRMVIDILVGFRTCTKEEQNDNGLGIICAMLSGRFPIIKSYETVVVSPLIQPGSSGSAVYNSSGEISAVIFAGSGDLSYGFAVPYEYIYSFLQVEAPSLPTQIPDSTMKLSKVSEESRESVETEKLYKACRTPKQKSLAALCNKLVPALEMDDLIFYKDSN